jgi:hypothetical protein
MIKVSHTQYLLRIIQTLMKSTLIKHESCVFVCSRFLKPPKVPGS